MLHGCLHEDATWENRHALRWSSVAKQPGVRLERGKPLGPGTKMAACWRLAQLCQRLCLTASWPLVNWSVSLTMETNVCST